MSAGISCILLIVSSYLFGSLSTAKLSKKILSEKETEKGEIPQEAGQDKHRMDLMAIVWERGLDFAKGVIPAWVAYYFVLGDGCALAAATAVILGQGFPIFSRFRGKKALTVSLGALFSLMPFATLIVIPVFGIVYLMVTGGLLTSALAALMLLTGMNILQGDSVVIIFAPLSLLLAAGLSALPHAIEEWREQEDKRKLVSYWLVPKELQHTKENVTVVTDSVSSLPPEMVQRYGIQIMPLALIVDNKTYRDGVDIDTRQFYRQLKEKQIVAKTSAPSPGEYQKLFTRLAAEYDAAVVLTPPKELTHTWDAAVLAKEQVTKLLSVDVVDSRVAGPAQGFLAIAAARAAAVGAPLENVLQTIQVAQQDVGLIAVLNTLEFLVAGGRVKAAKDWMASALRIYPIVTLIDGHINLVGMARTKSKAIKRMVNWLESQLAHDEAALACFHTDALEEANNLNDVLREGLNPSECFITEMTPVVGAHAGPGMVGVAWWRSQKIP